MKSYLAPTVDVLTLKTADVITTSGDLDNTKSWDFKDLEEIQ